MKVEYGKTGTYFYWVGLILLGVFLPTSKFGLSVTQFYLIILWLLLGLDVRGGMILSGIWHNIKTRFNDFIHNKVAVAMASMYLLHIVGLIYTSDFQYAFKDLRIKLPILLFPMIMSSMKPLNKKQFDTVIWFFIGSVFFVTVLGVIKFFRRDFVDVRELSVFVSHIRVSLCMVFSIFVLAYYFVKRNYNFIVKAIIVFLILWFLWQITLWESFISVLIIAALSGVLTLYFIFKSSNSFVKISIVAVMIIAAVVAVYSPYKIIRVYNNPDEVVVEQLDTHTKLGNPYVFDTINLGVEDGRYIGLYLSKGELISAWNKRSEKRINHEYEDAYFCLVRYMTSKDLRKDAEGVSMLTDEDVKNIEMLKKLKSLEGDLKDCGMVVRKDGMFEIVEVPSLEMINAEKILNDGEPLCEGLEQFIKVVESEVAEYRKEAAVKAAKEAEIPGKIRQELTVYRY